MTPESQLKLKTLVQKIQAANGDLSNVDVSDLTMRIKIHGASFDSSITGEVARSLWELQQGLYRAAATIIYHQPNIKRLSAAERKRLTLSFRIEDGCTELFANIKDAALELAKGFKTMESKDKKTVLLTLIVCCLVGWSMTEVCDVLEKRDEKSADLEKSKAMLEPVNNAIQLASKGIAKASKDADEVNFGPQKFTKEDIERLNSKTRSSASTETETGTYRVTGVHAEGGVLRVDLVDAETKESFSATILPKGILDDELPNSSAEIGALIDSGAIIEVTLIVKETRSKVERVIIDWRTVQE